VVEARRDTTIVQARERLTPSPGTLSKDWLESVPG
jgi:hypothetical protein